MSGEDDGTIPFKRLGILRMEIVKRDDTAKLLRIMAAAPKFRDQAPILISAAEKVERLWQLEDEVAAKPTPPEAFV